MKKNLVIAGLITYGVAATASGYGLLRLNCFLITRYNKTIGADIGDQVVAFMNAKEDEKRLKEFLSQDKQGL